MKLALKYPATPANAREHAALAVRVAWEQHETRLDYSAGSLEDLDGLVEVLREEGLTSEDLAEVLFVCGCYLGEVFVRSLGGRWVPTPRSALKDVSPWPMAVLLGDGSTWDPIGKAFRRLELGDSEYLPACFAAAAAGPGRESAR